MVVNDVADPLGTRGVLEPIASRLAPTKSLLISIRLRGRAFFCLEKNRDQNRINLLIQVFSGLYSLFLTISTLIFP